MDTASNLNSLRSVDLDRQDYLCFSEFRSTINVEIDTSSNVQATKADLNNDNDFLSLLKCAKTLYSQHGVLEMRAANAEGDGNETIYGQGALGQVTRVNADLSRPSNQKSDEIDMRVIKCAAKRYAGLRQESLLSGLIGGNRSTSLWDENGDPRNAMEARSFIMELRVLSHPDIRNSENVVKIQGLEWDDCQTIPKPIILMEGAGWDLSQFLLSFPSLPPSTKRSLSRDIAVGLDTLHNCGIIHGDLKPSNILIFEIDGHFTAKLTDFSHSLLDTGDFRCLPGGTEAFAAPEYEDGQLTDRLKLTDVYSYGLTFACLMIGADLFTKAYKEKREKEIRRHKFEDTMIKHVWNEIASLDDPNIDDQAMVRRVLFLTLQRDAAKRDLSQVRQLLSRGSLFEVGSNHLETVVERLMSQEPVSIPYQALAGLKRGMHSHVLRVLEHVADRENDSREAAAAFELAVCHISRFGIYPTAELKDDDIDMRAMEWLLRSAQAGDQRARLALIPVYEALGGHLPEELPIQDWLKDLVENHGCLRALDQLEHMNPTLYVEMKTLYRKSYCGTATRRLHQEPPLGRTMCSREQLRNWSNENKDNLLHYCACAGNEAFLRFLEVKGSIEAGFLDSTNNQGDTPLIQAIRAGHSGIVRRLLSLGANASVANHLNETALHFLVNIDNHDVDDIAQKLANAGACSQLQRTASGSSSVSFNSFEITGPGSAARRAVYRNNPAALLALINIEDSLPEDQLDGKTEKATIWQLLSLALKLQHSKVVEVLGEWLGPRAAGAINSRKFWHDNNLGTPLETCVFGPVSSNQSSGFDYPEKFLRVFRFGGSHREVLASCIAFLIDSGAVVEEYGVVCFAIKHNRRDAITELSANTGNPLYWARLAIENERYEIFQDLLERSSEADMMVAVEGNAGITLSFPLLFLSQIFVAGPNPTLLHHFTRWLRRAGDTNKIHWVPENQEEDEFLQELTSRSKPEQFYPLYMAYEQARFDIINLLFEFGASLQDKVERSHRRTMFQHIYERHAQLGTPENLGKLVQCAIANGSERIVSCADLDFILPRSNFWSRSHGRPVDASDNMSLRRYDVTWLQTGDGQGSILHWNKTSEETEKLTCLWEAISKADQAQKDGVLENGDPAWRIDKLDLVLRAALFSNWPAIKCLLNMGFNPDGSGELQLYFASRPSVTFPIMPLDVVQWTSYIPDDCCSSTGLELKRSNGAIAELLLERGGSRSCGRGYCLLANALLEFWAIISVSNKWVALFFRFIFFYIIGSLYFAAMIKFSGPLVATSVTWAWLICTGGFAILISTAWISNCYSVGRKTMRCSRHHIMLQLAFGGSSRIFWTAMLGYQSLSDSWFSSLLSVFRFARMESQNRYVELADDA